MISQDTWLFIVSYVFNDLKFSEKCIVCANKRLNLFDYLSTSFLDAYAVLRENGLLRRYKECSVNSLEPVGAVNWAQSAIESRRKGKAAFRTRVHRRSLDFLENQLIKYCAGLIQKKSNNSNLRERARWVTSDLCDIEPLDRVSLKKLSNIFIEPWRDDFRRIVNISKSMILGSRVSDDSYQQGESKVSSGLLITDQEWLIFEKFIRKWLIINHPSFVVSRKSFFWSDGSDPLVPSLNPDVVLTSDKQVVVVDCKHYKSELSKNMFSENKLHSQHLFQIFSYLSIAASKNLKESASGALVYPETLLHEPLKVRLHKYDCHIIPIRLNGSSQDLLNSLKHFRSVFN